MISSSSSYSISPTTTSFKRFSQCFINFMMLFFPVTSFLLIPAIQGTTVIAVLSAVLFSLIIAFPSDDSKPFLLKEFFIFMVLYIGLSILSQFLNLLYDIRFDKTITLVNKGNYLLSFMRASFITQTLYLVMVFIVYLQIKYFASYSVIEWIYWGLRLLCFYAIYECIHFLLTGDPGDFVTNRKFGNRAASLAQSATIAGFSMLRMKGYTGEPSMFTFTIFPFWALTFVLKRRFDSILLLCCLILTLSTTAYAGIILFLIAWLIYKRRYKQVIYAGVLMFIMLTVLQLDAFTKVTSSLYEFVFGGKLSGENVSSQERGSYMENHITYWLKLPTLSQLFGVGFGYIRSTDFFSTILVNNGIIGFIIFSVFYFKHLFNKIKHKDLKYAYGMTLITLYLIMMTTVPEFAYPSLWIFLGLSYLFENQQTGNETYNKHDGN